MKKALALCLAGLLTQPVAALADITITTPDGQVHTLPDKKNALFSGGASLLPGVGHALNQDWIPAAGFFAARALLLVASQQFNKSEKGLIYGTIGASMLVGAVDMWWAFDAANRHNQKIDEKIAALGGQEQPATTNLAIDVDAVPGRVSIQHDDVAVVIGIETYNDKVPPVRFAVRDAGTVRQYLTQAMGYKEENVISLTDGQATKSAFEKAFSPGGQVANFLKPGQNVFVYYAGHGVPDLQTQKPYLVPYDGDPNYAKLTGYPLETLYANLAALPAKSVTVVMDACFSGAGARADNSMLVADARPMMLKTEEVVLPPKVTVLAAATGTQVSSGFAEKQHGLFTYFFLKGLQGAADKNQDGKLTIGELHGYTASEVLAQARRLNREQTPVVAGPDVTLR